MSKEITTTAFGKITTPVTKPQQDFNKLTEKIAKLRDEIAATKALSERLEQRMNGEYMPATKGHNDQVAELVRLYDRAHQSGNFAGRELKKLEHLILEMAHQLIEEGGFDDLKEIYDRYSDEPFDEIDAETDEIAAEFARNMMEKMFGIKLDEDFDISDPEKFAAEMREKIQQKTDEINDKKASAKKSKKQQERADKQAVEAAKVSKSVREVYLDLVKTFHPDREPDEAEKVRKTAIMQRVTAAYEKNDLLVLLELQLEFERIDSASLNSIAESKLLHFNKVLNKQARELATELNEYKDNLINLGEMLADASGEFYRQIRIEQIEFMLNRRIKDMKKNTDLLKKDVRALSSSVALKAYLKSYKIPKPGRDDFSFGF